MAIHNAQICPLCGKTYSDYPALSRVCSLDICSDCGVREALIPQTKSAYIDLWSTAKGLTHNKAAAVLKNIQEKLKNRP